VPEVQLKFNKHVLKELQTRVYHFDYFVWVKSDIASVRKISLDVLKPSGRVLFNPCFPKKMGFGQHMANPLDSYATFLHG
jgi:hypothetical protein